MIKPAFDRFYRYAELTELLNALATEYPDLCAITSIGRSHEGREIWLATLTNARTGPAADKPAFWVDANIHATEVSPSTCALYALYKALSGYGSDPQLTRLLDTRALYIVPRANPDGAELLDERTAAFGRRPGPTLKERQDGLHLADVDGDGRVLSMRVRDQTARGRPIPTMQGC
jgi:murein tripeptide amidase MpaA